MNSDNRIEIEILLKNNAPIEDFENLSANDFHFLIYDTYGENSPVHFKKNIEKDALDKVSLFRVAEDLIRIIDREKFIKLTPLGALPKKVLVELYEHQHIFDELIEAGISKLWREENCIAILSTKVVLQIAGITKKTNGKLTLTKKGIAFLKEDKRQEFFESFISTFADKFNWGYHDSYPEKPIGQIGWTFTIYLLGKYGKSFQSDNFYGEKYLRAFPAFSEQFDDKSQFLRCYSVRAFQRFLEWFGLIEVERIGRYLISDEIKIKQSSILPMVFEIDN